MTDTAPLPTAPTTPAERHAAALALIDGQLVMLAELAELGMAIARDATRRALADDRDPDDRRDPVLDHDRAARAVRMAFALQARLLKDQADLDRGEGLARTVRAEKAATRVRRLFSRAIDAGELGGPQPGRLQSQIQDRLWDEDEAALADGPLEAVVARICHALRLPKDWAAKNFPVAEAEDAAAAPGSSPGGPDQRDREPPESGPSPLRAGARQERPCRIPRSRAPPAPGASDAFA